MTKSINSVFDTEDLNLAAYLKMQGYELCGIDRGTRDNKTKFSFLDQENREQDILNFFNDKGGFMQFCNAWANLKSLLHQSR